MKTRRQRLTPRSLEGIHARRLLIVDDDLDARTILEEFFRAYGYATSVCKTGQEALALMDGMPFDLVLLDLHMPEMSGFEVMRSVRSRGAALAEVPIVIVSATSTSGLTSADAYFTKPVPLMELLACVERLTGGPSARVSER